MNDRPVDFSGSAAQRLTVGVGNFDEFWPWDIRRCQHSTGSMQAQMFQLGEMDTQEKDTSLVAYTAIQPDTLRLGHRDFWRSVEPDEPGHDLSHLSEDHPIFPELVCFWLLPFFVFQATILTEHHPTILVFDLQQICCQLLFKKLQNPCFWWLLGSAVPFISRYINIYYHNGLVHHQYTSYNPNRWFIYRLPMKNGDCS